MRPTGIPAMELRLLGSLCRRSKTTIGLNRIRPMPSKPSRFSGELQNGIPRLARRLRGRMNELGLSQTELSARCAGASLALFPDGNAPTITRERIAKILMHCKANAAKSAARVISHQELQVFASVLQVAPEWLTFQRDRRDLVLWDPVADEHRARQILHLINDHEDRAAEVLFWADHLICSLETPEFMHKHHEALFCEIEVLGAYDEKRRLVNVYDRIGNARRRRLFDPKQKRRNLAQLIFASDLQRIAQGIGEYAGIRKELRKACLENARDIIADGSLGIGLVVVEDNNLQKAKVAFRDYDAIGVFDDRFVLWRYHSGKIAWSENSAHAKAYRGIMDKLTNSGCICRGPELTRLFTKLAASIH